MGSRLLSSREHFYDNFIHNIGREISLTIWGLFYNFQSAYYLLK